MKQLGPGEVERLIRDLMAECGLVPTSLTVRREPSRWVMEIRDDTNRVLYIELPETLSVMEFQTRLQRHLLRRV